MISLIQFIHEHEISLKKNIKESKDEFNWELLKKLYDIYSPSKREFSMIKFIEDYLNDMNNNIVLSKDEYGNLYVTKGDGKYYACLIAHVDQFEHERKDSFRIKDDGKIIKGKSNYEDQELGADDKNGIVICLEILKKYDNIKVVFFVEEEIGIKGSKQANYDFFKDCKYVLCCDRRGNSEIVTSINRTKLCSDEFIKDIKLKDFGYHEVEGRFSDIYSLKYAGISCCNIACGYYDNHTNNEFIIKKDLIKCWKFINHIIKNCKKQYIHNKL